MKKIFYFLLLLVSFSAKGQWFQDTTATTIYGYKLKAYNLIGVGVRPVAVDALGNLVIGAGSSGTPGGSSTSVQYNNAGTFGGASLIGIDNTNNRLGIGTLTPQAHLDILDSLNGSNLFLIRNPWNGTASNMGFQFKNASNSAFIYFTSPSYTANPNDLFIQNGTADIVIYTSVEGLRVKNTGAIKFPTYGVHSNTGTTAYLLAVDAAGNVIETSPSSGTPAGSDTYIQYNNAGAFGGSANLIWNGLRCKSVRLSGTLYLLLSSQTSP